MLQLVPWEAQGWETLRMVSPIRKERLGSPSCPLPALKPEAQSCPQHHPWCCPASQQRSGSASSGLWKTATPESGLCSGTDTKAMNHGGILGSGVNDIMGKASECFMVSSVKGIQPCS